MVASATPRIIAHTAIAAFVGVIVIAGGSYNDSRLAPSTAAVSRPNTIATPVALVDESASVEIAAEVAAQVKLPVAQEVIAYAQSIKADTSLANTVDNSLVKPQIVATEGVESREMTNYVAKDGDSVESIARKFDLRPSTVRWANDMNEWDKVQPGQKLTILPVNGILHTVSKADTAASLADRYDVEADLIISFNDAEIEGLKEGQKIIIPGGSRDSAPRYGVPTNSYVANNFTASYIGNGYDYGYCTYYAATRVKVPSNWGNANTWDDYARLSGWTVSSKPKAGAIAQSDYMSGLGHVAYVEEVSEDGRKVKISDMNGIAGWGVVGTAWMDASTYPNYIYR